MKGIEKKKEDSVAPEATAIAVSLPGPRDASHPQTSCVAPAEKHCADKPSALWQRRYGQRASHPSFLKVPYVPKDAPR